MRDLFENELQFVSGAGCAPTPPSGCGCAPTPPSRGGKGNNGFGQEKNGREDGSLAAPGGSGSTPGDKEGSTIR